MAMRVLSGFLWLYLAWYGWSMYAGLAGINPLWGAVFALAALAFVSADRVRRDWKQRSAEGASMLTPVSRAGEPA